MLKNCDIKFLVDFAAAMLSGRRPLPEEVSRLEEIAQRERRLKCPFCETTPALPHIGCSFARDECSDCKRRGNDPHCRFKAELGERA